MNNRSSALVICRVSCGYVFHRGAPGVCTHSYCGDSKQVPAWCQLFWLLILLLLQGAIPKTSKLEAFTDFLCFKFLCQDLLSISLISWVCYGWISFEEILWQIIITMWIIYSINSLQCSSMVYLIILVKYWYLVEIFEKLVYNYF